jgi:hypothetical protein
VVITRSAVTRREIITSTTPTERQVFSEVSVGPEGARFLLRILAFSNPPALVIASSAQAAVLEEAARMVRKRLLEQEQAGLTHPNVDVAEAEPAFAPVTREFRGCAPMTAMPRS